MALLVFAIIQKITILTLTLRQLVYIVTVVSISCWLKIMRIVNVHPCTSIKMEFAHFVQLFSLILSKTLLILLNVNAIANIICLATNVFNVQLLIKYKSMEFVNVHYCIEWIHKEMHVFHVELIKYNKQIINKLVNASLNISNKKDQHLLN